MVVYIAIGIVIIILIYILITFNILIKKRNRVREAFSTMDVYLKKRWDLIPNIVECVKGYVKHENTTLEEVVSLRNTFYEEMNTDTKINTNSKLTPRIAKLIALSENYPELRASENFRNLTKELSKVEEDIANARKYYNACVRIMNNQVEMFPSNLVAKMFGVHREKMFEANESERENVKVDL